MAESTPKGGWRVGLAVGILASGVLLAGCGSSKSSSATSSTAAGQSLRRWELRVKNGSSALAPTGSFMERLAGLVGWPGIAEAATGVPGCTVSAPGPGGTITAVTDSNGKAVLNGPLTGNGSVATVDCPGGSSPDLQIPINGPPGSIVEVEVEVKSGVLQVTAEAEDASPSEPSISEPSVSEPSEPSEEEVSLSGSGSNSGKG